MSKEEIELRDGDEFYRVKDSKKLASYEIIDGEVDFTYTAPAYGKYREQMLSMIDGIAVKPEVEETAAEVVEPPTPDPEPEDVVEPTKAEQKAKVSRKDVKLGGHKTPRDFEGCPEYHYAQGDTTPEVVAFARSVMTQGEFIKHYKGRVSYAV